MRRSIKIFVVVVLITGMSLGVFVPSAPGYAVALVDDFIIAITALASTMGIDFGITGGWDVYRNFMAGELETYAAGAGTTLPGILGDAKIGHGQSGRLIIDNPTLLKMRTIIAALTATWGLVNNSSETVVDTEGYYLSTGDPVVMIGYRYTPPTYNNLDTATYFEYGVSYEINNHVFYTDSYGSLVVDGSSVMSIGTNFNYYAFAYNLRQIELGNEIQYLSVTAFKDTSIPMDSSSSIVTTGRTYNDVFGNMTAESLTIETTTIDIPSAEDVGTKGVAVSVGAVAGASYADVLEAIQTGVLAGDLTAVATYEESSTLDEDLVVTPDYSAGDFQSPGLQSVFPFCLPFDIYNFVTALAADPVAPSFDVPFVVPGIVDYTFHLDLSAFNSVASILRTLELLAFCVGLAFVTRHLIRG